LTYEPWSLLAHHLTDVRIHEYCFGCLFLASGSIMAHSANG
jgi:hypothetical protein